MNEILSTAQPHLASRACNSCGKVRWSIPAHPRALPGCALDPAKVAAICMECGNEATVADTVTVVMLEEDEA